MTATPPQVATKPDAAAEQMFPTLTPAQVARVAAVAETHEIRHVFVMAGAVPNTGWLQGCVTLDSNGFIATGPDLSRSDLATATWPLARAPHLLETSLPGVFAVGDVRSGNLKRVASAVGQGAIAVSLVHRALHE